MKEAQEIVTYLKALANGEIASHSSRFFKTGKGEYGYGDQFLGIRVPQIRQAVKHFKHTSLGAAEQLLKNNYHEIRLFAVLLLVQRFSRAGSEERTKIYQLYLNNTQYINNWDIVDSSAYQIVGGYLDDKDRSILFDLATSEMLWERRIAVIATFFFIRKNQFAESLQISELLLHDDQDLIHKAVGWMLREIGKRDLKQETCFLKIHYSSMPRTMLRYAIEKFPPEERKRYLTGQV